MNQAQHKELVKLYGELEEIRERLEAVRGHVQSTFERMSERRNETDEGELAESEAEHLDNVCVAIDEVIERISDAKGEDKR